ncbi:NADH-quinone oxidoreductase subunit G [Rhodobacter veldkampii DSM 11550]|uniref:NADH-quinone oxidoreductase n=1 Tax=Phaeovulum veldkampii DSM 11550 TaxID=1185920 RepID=A0A2T4JKX3_9RHOB|nr:NADH-quinone oxidoreductase subunit NuoG [Phaeovulum veldkampii]MBK5947369.1 NADH-quinone oxidoreductase subunit G [Phaeovulum veldkampii DSM 11550]PTE18544.1 NADH-quinone oxidoreductase subunit G [Phaeovulum veldkampii DSM 11550]TDQ59166.1 NADH dehydrogenase subunit G [Phaeovulum veldkampii DSM 11550]
MTNLRKLIIDGHEVEVDPALTIIQACEQAGIEVPRFCYHERLTIAGNCRMCLVEVVGGPPKPTASCAMQVKDLRPGPNGEPPVVKTNSPMVRKAREGVMEFLLINHPLDCPICDQGGECDLQDQAMAYGVDFSRYREAKRASEDLDLGPLVATTMTRCISCTRCVRFTTEVAGITQMGQTGRGEDAEITSYLGMTLESNLQGNIIDLCPVGALTSKPYAFTARPWELTKTETIDVMDGLGANIRVDTKGREVMRILPRNHDGVNEEWISDKTRFVWDGLRRQRLDVPYIRENGRLRKAGWPEALAAAARAMTGKKVLGLVGDLAPVEAAFALRQLIEGLGGTVECRTDGARLPIGNRSAYVGTARIEEIDTAGDIWLIGTNPREESPVLNARIRKAWAAGADVTLIGQAADLTYDYRHLGTDRAALVAAAAAAGAAGKPALVIVGQGALNEADGEAVLAHAMALTKALGGKMLVLHTAAARVGAMDVGAVTEGGLLAAVEGVEVIYNLGADEVEIAPAAEGGPFVIYQGSHGDRGANRADVILPAAAYTEENALFVNTEGRPQLAFRAGFAPGEANENWAILRALSADLGRIQPWNDLAGLRRALVAAHPHLGAVDTVADNGWHPLPLRDPGRADFRPAIRDFYLTNPIARASTLMAELSAQARARAVRPMAAE